MDEFRPSSYGDGIYTVYDDMYSGVDPECIRLLTELAGDGPALELGIGTGRVAIPLHEAGVQVQGIDASARMLEVLKGKVSQNPIQVSLGDFANFDMDQKFQLIYIVFNTIFALLTQQEQANCFSSAAQHLGADSYFLLEAFIPNQARFEDNQSVRVVAVSEKSVKLEATVHDPVAQTVLTQHIVVDDDGSHLYPVKLRYIWPSEMDLMARLAGLELSQRWGAWDKADFDSGSSKHISVYRLQR